MRSGASLRVAGSSGRVDQDDFDESGRLIYSRGVRRGATYGRVSTAASRPQVVALSIDPLSDAAGYGASFLYLIHV